MPIDASHRRRAGIDGKRKRSVIITPVYASSDLFYSERGSVPVLPRLSMISGDLEGLQTWTSEGSFVFDLQALFNPRQPS